MAKKKTFHIATPNVKTIYLGKQVKQRARYIELKEEIEKDELEKDIEAGAVIYKPFLEELKKTPSRFNIITAPTEEDGLRAVQYLAQRAALEKGFSCGREDDLLQDERYSQEFDLKEKDLFFDDLEDLFSDEDEDPDADGSFPTNDHYIPVIPIQEVLNQEYSAFNQTGFASFGMEMQNNNAKKTPWWDAGMYPQECDGIVRLLLFRRTAHGE